jgi:hypothetical protein
MNIYLQCNIKIYFLKKDIGRSGTPWLKRYDEKIKVYLAADVVF